MWVCEKNVYYECEVLIFVLVTGGLCHDPQIHWVLATQSPERERSRVTFVKERVLKIRIFLASSRPAWKAQNVKSRETETLSGLLASNNISTLSIWSHIFVEIVSSPLQS
jgi:hypothetical protein